MKRVDSEDSPYGTRELQGRRKSGSIHPRKFSDITFDTRSKFYSNRYYENEKKRSFCQIGSTYGGITARRKSHQFFNSTTSDKPPGGSTESVYCAYAEYVIDYLRSLGIKASLVLHIAPKNGKDEPCSISPNGKFSRYTYNGEAIFYGVLRQSTWQFGLKDIGLATLVNLINYTATNRYQDNIAER